MECFSKAGDSRKEASNCKRMLHRAWLRDLKSFVSTHTHVLNLLHSSQDGTAAQKRTRPYQCLCCREICQKNICIW